MRTNYIYARVACKQVSDSRDAISWQINRCQEHAYRLHLDTPTVEFEQHSGNAIPPKLKQLLSSMESGDRLIVDSPSRLSRDFGSFVQVKADLAAKGCRLEFARNNLGVQLQPV
jgi:DNA invertase Pin-like site-specific DNA recombinase